LSVVDLTRRATADQDAYNRSLRSDDSLILISPFPDNIETASVDFDVGEYVFDSARSEKRALSSEGFTLRPRQSVVVYSAQRVSLPNNVFGLLSGKGRLIYHGVFISQGKVDPGFKDNLRIGLYNGSKKAVQLKTGMPICSCTFFQMETHVQDAASPISEEPVKPLRPTFIQQCRAFWLAHWKWIIGTLVLGIAVLIVRILGLWK
jgi:deoxycytidine triphosphate deaminase